MPGPALPPEARQLFLEHRLFAPLLAQRVPQLATSVQVLQVDTAQQLQKRAVRNQLLFEPQGVLLLILSIRLELGLGTVARRDMLRALLLAHETGFGDCVDCLELDAVLVVLRVHGVFAWS